MLRIWLRVAGMYPHVLEAVQSKKVLLEWDHKQGKAPAPLLKVCA